MLVSIDIDFEIHKAIENERRSFDEPPHLALRRLLKIHEPPCVKVNEKPLAPTGRPWRAENIEIPHGSDARMTYQRGAQVYEGQFLNGRLVVAGRSFNTLSEAASALGRTKSGTTTNLDGWKYWDVKLPGDNNWQPIRRLRAAARRAKH